MNYFTVVFRKLWLPATMIFGLLIFGDQAAASEAAPKWRATYDVVMLWVNFSILVALFLKFGKAPLKAFLQGKRADIKTEIDQLEKQRDELTAGVKEATQKLEESTRHFHEVSERIIQTGEKAKQSIITDAKKQSQMLLEDAKRKIESQVLKAEKDFKSELIDASVDLALENIGKHLTPDDNRRFVEYYFSSIPDKK